MPDWLFALLVMFGGIIVMLAVGMPVVFSFITVNLIGALVFLGGDIGLMQMIRNMRGAVSQYSLVPIPLFVLMGEIMLHTGMATKSIEAIDKMISRVPGRLSIVSVLAGTSFAALSGSSVANAAVVGKTLLPEMRNRGYHDSISIGPIAAVGGVAVLIPPSALAVMLGSLAKISINDLLIAGLIPGALMIALFLGYILLRCKLNPSVAPSYEIETLSWRERLMPVIRNVMPLFIIFAVVVGTMLTGIATPTESAAMGVLATIVIGLIYRSVTIKNLITSVVETLKFSSMILFIICCSATFSQVLAFTGATETVADLVINQSGLSPLMIVGLMMLLLLILGCFMESASMIMLTLPVFLPIINGLGIDLLWFGILMMIALEIGLATPPFGMLLFVVQGAMDGKVKMQEIYKAVVPYIVIEIGVLVLIMLVPSIVTWLPKFMN
jgi:tripartite ATP-independent transporter DctM subunit